MKLNKVLFLAIIIVLLSFIPNISRAVKSDIEVEKISVISKSGIYKTGDVLKIEVTFSGNVYKIEKYLPTLKLKFGSSTSYRSVLEGTINDNKIVYEYTIDDRMIEIDNGKEFTQSKRKAYVYHGKLYIKFDYTVRIPLYLFGPEELKVKQGFCEVEPVKWLIDEESGKWITKDIVWGGAEYDNIDIIINNLEREILQCRERDDIAKFESGKKDLFFNLFHKRHKTKALPEGTYQMEQGKPNDEQEEMAETTRSKQPVTNEFKEEIRKAAQSSIEESIESTKGETKVTEEAPKFNPVEEKVNNILDAQINRNDGERYTQPQYFAKPQQTRTDIRYYVKGEDGDIYPTDDPNKSDCYIGPDGVLRQTKVNLSKKPYVPKSKQNSEMAIEENNKSKPRVIIPNERFIKPTEDVDQDDRNDR